MTLVLKSLQPDASAAGQMKHDQPVNQWRGLKFTQGALTIPSGCCMTGKGADPHRIAVCQSAGECIQNRMMSAPTCDADFFEC